MQPARLAWHSLYRLARMELLHVLLVEGVVDVGRLARHGVQFGRECAASTAASNEAMLDSAEEDWDCKGDW